MYYPCSENKDADQLRGYHEADLRLCFRPCKLLVFSRTGSYYLFCGFQQFLVKSGWSQGSLGINKYYRMLICPAQEHKQPVGFKSRT